MNESIPEIAAIRIPRVDLEQYRKIVEGNEWHPSFLALADLAEETAGQPIAEEATRIRAHIKECLSCRQAFEAIQRAASRQ